jgi:hypothetical protein
MLPAIFNKQRAAFFFKERSMPLAGARKVRNYVAIF